MLTAEIRATISALYRGSNDLGTPEFSLDRVPDIPIRDGTGANQADLLFADTRTLASETAEDLDLAGELIDPLGATIGMAKVKAILIRAAAGNTNDVIVGGQTVNGFLGPFGAAAHTVAVPPGGALLLAAPVAGWAVSAGDGDLLQVENGGAGSAVTYDVVIIGTSSAE